MVKKIILTIFVQLLLLELGTFGTVAADTTGGAKIGLSISKVDFDSEPPSPAERTYRPGLTLGGFLNIDIAGPFGVQLELAGTDRGAEVIFEGNTVGTYSFLYLDLVVMGRIAVPLGPVSLYALAGPSVHYLHKATFTNVSGDIPVENDLTDDSSRYDLGATAGAGIAFGPLLKGNLFLESRYAMGFVDVDSANDNITLQNRGISILIGYEYRPRSGKGGGKGHGTGDPTDLDRDDDGVPDKEDECPEEEGVAANKGCPDGDDDGDGVLNSIDQCPQHKDNPDEANTADGCPDRDDDGVWDHLEDAACVDQPEDKDGFEDEDGCPDTDNDGDGILDADDECPLVAEDVDKHLDDDGCPDEDNDGDGILDAQDGPNGTCKDQPETRNGWQDDDGCKDSVPRQIASNLGVFNRLTFARKAKGDVEQHALNAKKSSRALKRVAKMLSEHTDIGLFVVAYSPSQDVSDANAQAVKDALTEQGIQEERLRTLGCVVPSTGKKKLRRTRVEFGLVGGTPEDPCVTPISESR